MPYADPKEQKRASRKAMRELRAKRKKQQEELEATNLTQKPDRKFKQTYEQYKNFFPDATFEDYLTEKRRYESVSTEQLRDPRIEQILDRALYPMPSPKCKRFRLQISGNIQKDPFFCASHHTKCSSCQGLYHEWKHYSKGANAW